MQFQMIVGKEIRKDCSCDSECIINIMPKVSVTMQENFHWIPNGGKLYLVMYNAGGRGTGSTINQYTQILEEKTWRSFGKCQDL